MQKIKIHVKNAPAPVARYSQGILVDHTLYVQGIIAFDAESGKLNNPPPVRTTVQAKMPFGALIEAEAIASGNKA